MASKGINKVILVGNLGNAPDVKFTAGGAQITSISIATSESWKDKNSGQTQEKTEWHKVVFFGKLAEITGTYLKKGSQVYVEGKLKTDKYQDKATGKDCYSTSVTVDSFSGVLQMLGSAGQSSHAQAESKPERHQQQSVAQSQGFDDNCDGDNFDNDLPF